ncbi:NmrA family NAD(P)-binding protein [Lysinibacillus pakistanensis]|uniref:NmrA family NAD(P)-binding protein n=1 Tax=Lysinibacillus pakistanensis TaxID=759811 RepID=UPI003D2B452A
MIVVIGATGMIGRELVKSLMKRDTQIRVISRDPNRLLNEVNSLDCSAVEFMAADVSNPDNLHRALSGASQLFLALSNTPRQVEIEQSIIQKAIEVGIEHVVKISCPLYQESSPVAIAGWHQEIEQTLMQSGLKYTILRPYAFMQNILKWRDTISSKGVFFGCMRDAQCNFIDCRDIADVAAEIFMNRKLAGRIYTLTGAKVYSYPQVAEKLTILLNHPVRYIDMDPDILRQNLIKHNEMPIWLANHVVEIQIMSVMVPEKPTDTVRCLLGKEPRSLESFLYETKEKFL